jgi:2-haloacid dehalogenase
MIFAPWSSFGTVVDWRTSLITELARFGHERGLSADWTALVDAWRAAYRPALDEVAAGGPKGRGRPDEASPDRRGR